jgi:dUTP pyrophosphatase
MTHQPLSVAVQRLDPDLPLPATARNGDAGVDLYARENATIAAKGGRILMPTGLAIAIPLGFAGFVVPRSGLALKHGITLVNTPGIIDSGYRGELKVVMINTDPTVDYVVTRGDRIAQILIQRIETIDWNEVDSLDGEDRGGGFGHSGR